MSPSLLKKIEYIKAKYIGDGIEIVGVFGSQAREEATKFSDIDITYKINYDIFFQKYRDGFSQILKIEEVKEALEKALHTKVDFISLNASGEALRKEIEKDLIYV